MSTLKNLNLKQTGRGVHVVSLTISSWEEQVQVSTESKKNKLSRNYQQKKLLIKDIGFIFGLY